VNGQVLWALNEPNLSFLGREGKKKKKSMGVEGICLELVG
jgi:hypothetical protein